jgi:membrane fusion protein, multidrug efflux system
MSLRRILFFILIIAIAGGVIFRVVKRAEEMKKIKAAKKPQTEKIIPVEAAKAVQKTIEDILTLTGDVKGLNVASVFPKVPGKMMKKVKDVGDAVKKGETIALIDRDEPALKYAPSDVASPLDGVVTKYFTDLGQNVSQTTPLCEIAELSPIKVVVNVTEKDLPKVKVSQDVRFINDAYPGQTFKGKISKISEALDLDTRSSEVEIFADNPGNLLKPGMFARVSIVLGVHTGAIVIPKNALEQSDEESFIYLIRDNKVLRKKIEPGLIFENEVEIVKGLQEGDEVITVGWHNVNDGTTVEVVV